jgi:hypothetical protein
LHAQALLVSLPEEHTANVIGRGCFTVILYEAFALQVDLGNLVCGVAYTVA